MGKVSSIAQKKITLYVLLFLFSPAMVLAWEGRVVGVNDGDALTVIH